MRRALEHALFGLLPVLLAALAFYYAFSGGYAAGDFRHSFLVAGWRQLHGANPYGWSTSQIARDVSFPYPALVTILLEPFVLLPGGVAADVYLVLCLAAIVGALYLVGVRDWRVFGVAMLWSPVMIGWQTGNFTLPLTLGLAAAWRYRDRPWLVGLLAATLISIKPVLFPVAVWLIVTRRYRAVIFGAGFGLIVNAAAWTIVGWGEFGHWLNLVSAQSSDLYRTGYSLTALASHLGASRTAGTVVQLVVVLALVVVCGRLGRARHDSAAFAAAISLCLAVSPLVDQHYFVLIAVPLAIAFPRLRWPWALPLALWFCPATGGTAWQVGVWLAAATVTFLIIERKLLTNEGSPDGRPDRPDELPEGPPATRAWAAHNRNGAVVGGGIR